MLTDSETGEVVVGNGEDEGLGLEGDPVGGDETGERHEDDEGGVQPVDVLVCEGDIVSVLFAIEEAIVESYLHQLLQVMGNSVM